MTRETRRDAAASGARKRTPTSGGSSGPSLFGGDELRRFCQASVAVLERNADAINALNVYPVPDGDTGTNMTLTMRTVCDEIGKCQETHLDAVAQAMARGALLGARGNSGIIASQFLRGMARCFSGMRAASVAELAGAFADGSASAYKAVGNPVEGTMLTVMRQAAQSAERAVARGADNPQRLFQSAWRGAAVSVRKTPQLLAVLRQAGVVDAGGQGFALMLKAAALSLRGEDPAAFRIKVSAGAAGRVNEAFLSAVDEEYFGNCIQFTLEGLTMSVDELRAGLARVGKSVVVIGDEQLAKVHVHSAAPEPVLAYAGGVGVLDRLKVENIDAQHVEFAAARRAERPRAIVGVVAVAWGAGLEKLFSEMGAVVVRGGQTMNPSVQQLLDAVAEANADVTVLLPNNPNVVRTAQQALEFAQLPLRVVPTRSLPQGVAAMLALNPEQGVESIVAAMERARAFVNSGEVVASVRASTVDGVQVPEGALMALLDDKLVAVGSERVDVLHRLAVAAGASDRSLLTLYWGGGLTADAVRADVDALKQRIPSLAVETVEGGQPHYLYLVAVE
ncbi:MAG: DAK2 domain-containing protein [Dehalococcoidia bacterium]|nr:DAK2 domain-containing protein [Dehalococcoidia bacterium]